MIKTILRAISAITGHDEDIKSIAGAAMVTDGVVGVADYRRHASALSATPVRVRFPQRALQVIITPIGSGIMKIVMNAPDVSLATTSATGANWLAQPDSKDANMMHRRITVGDPIERRTITNLDGIDCLDFTGDATVTAVDFEAVGVAP